MNFNIENLTDDQKKQLESIGTDAPEEVVLGIITNEGNE